MSLADQSDTPRKSLGRSSMQENRRWFHRETLHRCTRQTATLRVVARLYPAHAADATGSKSRPSPDNGHYVLVSSGTGKTHIALALGLAACQRGHRVRFITAAALVHELIEARDERKLLRFQKQIASYELLIVDELGFVPLSKTGAELLFEMLSQRYERGSTMLTSNLPFAEWTEILGSERLTGALLDRLTHHVHILEMNGDSFRLKQSRRKRNPNS